MKEKELVKFIFDNQHCFNDKGLTLIARELAALALIKHAEKRLNNKENEESENE